MLVVGFDHVRVHVVHETTVSGYGPDEVLIVLCTKDDRLQLRLHSLYDTFEEYQSGTLQAEVFWQAVDQCVSGDRRHVHRIKHLACPFAAT